MKRNLNKATEHRFGKMATLHVANLKRLLSVLWPVGACLATQSRGAHWALVVQRLKEGVMQEKGGGEGSSLSMGNREICTQR